MTCLHSIVWGFGWEDPMAGDTHLREAGIAWRVCATCLEDDAEGLLGPQQGSACGSPFLMSPELPHILVGELPGSSGIQR